MRELCVEDLHDFYSSLNIVSVLEARKMMIKAGQVPCVAEKRVKSETDLLEELGLHGRRILKTVLKEYREMLGSCENCNRLRSSKGRFTHSMPFPCHAVPLRV